MGLLDGLAAAALFFCFFLPDLSDYDSNLHAHVASMKVTSQLGDLCSPICLWSLRKGKVKP